MTGAFPQIGFGGGCHWCTEAVFMSLKGVQDVRQGYIRADPPHASFSEAVLLRFDPAIIPLPALVEIHLRTHSSRSNHKLRGKYRSAVYTMSGTQADEAQHAIAEIAAQEGEGFVTHVLPYRGFRPSDARFHRYAENHVEGPFCRAYIDPKLRLLMQDYAARLR